IDLTQFKRWYNQAGTPRLVVKQDYDAQQGIFSLNIEQLAPLNQPDNAPLHIPFAIELLDAQGHSVPLSFAGNRVDHVLDVTNKQQSFSFDGLTAKPVAVLLEDFSAPCIVQQQTTQADLLHIMRFARSDFSRWDAQQQLFISAVKAAIKTPTQNLLDDEVINALRSLVIEKQGDLALIAELLKLPSFDTLAAEFTVIPVDEIVAITQQFEQQIAGQLHREFTACYQSLIDDGSVSAAAVAVRALKGMCLHYLAKINELENNQLLISAANSHNMTNVLAALSAVVKADSSLASELLNQFDSQWRHDVLVMDKWFALQAMQGADNAIANIEKLYQHPCFDFSNPNRVRALVGSFSYFGCRWMIFRLFWLFVSFHK
ncbi:hypothetical protein LCGC14_1208720, partial [marine sediment metagenome]